MGVSTCGTGYPMREVILSFCAGLAGICGSMYTIATEPQITKNVRNAGKLKNSTMFDTKKPDSWDNIFFQEAVLWARKSHDTQTQCGCVLVKDKTSISSGYNGFIRDIDDSVLPNIRPEKYPFMIHAESNAIYNSARIGRCTMGASAYITAPPCLQCLQMLYQCGIKEILYSDISNPKMCIYSHSWSTIHSMIKDKIDLRFIAKEQLDCRYLQESVREIQKKNKKQLTNASQKCIMGIAKTQ
jgi:dCMP deaminase